MQCFITPPGGSPLALHDLGEVSILGQQSSFTPEEMPQREMRTITLKVAVWQQNWGDNYGLVSQIRTALQLPRVMVQLTQEGGTYTPTGGGATVTVASSDVYNREFDVVSCDLPDNPNSWGTYQQEINISLRTEFNALQTNDTDHLTATFEATGGAGQIELGRIIGWKVDYKSTRYSEMRNVRERAAGQVSCQGEFIEDTGTDTVNISIGTRRTQLLASLQAMQAAVNARDGLLVLGANKSTLFFNKTVKVDDFQAEINQAVTGIKWSMTASYTEFPNEATFAAADFSVAMKDELESGDVTLQFSGKIGAVTEAVALSKLALVRTSVLAQTAGAFAATGPFTLTDRVSSDVTTRQVSVGDDDTETPASSGATEFIELSFSESYRKRSSNIYSFNLTVSDNEDQRSGIRTRSYAGRVVCSGANYTSARNNAVQAAYSLGRASGSNPEKQMRISSRLTETYRHQGTTQTTDREFVGLDFSFEYLAPVERVYLELTKEAAAETFGDTTERWSGFVIAKDEANARSQYASIVQPLFSGLKRSETTSIHQQKIQQGAFSTSAMAPPVDFTASTGLNTLATKLDFSVSLLRERTTSYAVRYGIRVDIDYAALRKTVTISGKFAGTKAQVEDAQREVAGNKLDLLLSNLGFSTSGSPPSQPATPWKRINRSRGAEFEQIGDSSATVSIGAAPSNAYIVSMDFSETFVTRLTGISSILQCEVSEDIQYSGTRWVEGAVPDGPSILMNCGTTMATRTVQGNVTATSESVGMAWVSDMKALTFPSGTGAIATPSTRYLQPPKITKSFEFIPMLAGTPRGGSADMTFVKISFSFSELIPDAQYV